MHQPLELVFGICDGDRIRFEVLRLTCPNAKTDWYASQLDAEIHINVGTFRGYRSLVIFSNDFHLFRASLNRLLLEETVSAALKTGDFLSIELGRRLLQRLDAAALERDGEMVLRDSGAENWEWRLTMDRTSLDILFAAVMRVSERYPTWSVPKR